MNPLLGKPFLKYEKDSSVSDRVHQKLILEIKVSTTKILLKYDCWEKIFFTRDFRSSPM